MECTMMLKIENLAERAQECKLNDELKWFHINTMIGKKTRWEETRQQQQQQQQ